MIRADVGVFPGGVPAKGQEKRKGPLWAPSLIERTDLARGWIRRCLRLHGTVLAGRKPVLAAVSTYSTAGAAGSPAAGSPAAGSPAAGSSMTGSSAASSSPASPASMTGEEAGAAGFSPPQPTVNAHRLTNIRNSAKYLIVTTFLVSRVPLAKLATQPALPTKTVFTDDQDDLRPYPLESCPWEIIPGALKYTPTLALAWNNSSFIGL